MFARDINGTKKRFFEKTLKTSGSPIIINGIETKALIRQFKDDGVIGEDHFEAYIPIEVSVQALDTFFLNGVEYLIKVANVWQGVYTRCSINPLYQTINVQYTGSPIWQFKVCPMDESVTLNNGSNYITTLNMSSIIYLKRDDISKQIQKGTRFFLYGAVYKVFGVTYANSSVLKLFCENDAITAKDDVQNQIADNSDITPIEVTYTITATNGANGSIAPLGATEVNQGTSKTFTFTPFKGYMLDKVFVDDSEVEVTDYQYTFSNVMANHTINVTFKAIPVEKFSIVSSVANSGGSISPLGTTTLEKGQSQTYTIITNEGYGIQYVKVDGAKVILTDNQYTFENITSNHTIEVSFVAKETYIAKINCRYNGTATINSTTIGEGETEYVSIVEGSNPILTIIPNEGYKLNTVKIGTDDYTSQVVDNKIVIDDDMAIMSDISPITITFAKIVTYTIQATNDDKTSISPSGTVVVEEGKSQTFTITANEGETLKVKIDGSEVEIEGNTYTFSNVTSNHTIDVYVESAIPSVTYTLHAITSTVGEDYLVYNKDNYIKLYADGVLADETSITSTEWSCEYSGGEGAFLFFQVKNSTGIHLNKNVNFGSQITVTAVVDGVTVTKTFTAINC